MLKRVAMICSRFEMNLNIFFAVFCASLQFQYGRVRALNAPSATITSAEAAAAEAAATARVPAAAELPVNTINQWPKLMHKVNSI